ncbi:alpha/beta hydrolase [Modestobacter sp. VKM Ac-2979]|uniref:alpha/beta hydrolase n=1 Tax=unclassified Modestobacter TaxID=2643866 RepID=UPI0022AB563A|nr:MULTISPECIES: alpha/beta hydrolase [unclassified Modestobacter]MCZ2813816.1 alpha/beta hydrolase [Modestobacter sp. VKM Ac-2979]MCZ2844209.1 alpha/beta hydrolase [Modestobacter sp. VKM Ac-2980]
MSLYRDFATVEELTAQYDIEATVPDFGAYATDFVARSAATREALGGTLDVRYGATLTETYDVFPGAGEGLSPALYFVHGGFWKATDSKVWSYVADGMAPHGVVTVVESYTLAPAVSVAEITRQHRAAFAHLYRNAEEFGVDRSKIVVAGHSAGGHAVGALLATDWAGEYGLPAQPFAGALPFSAVMDLRPLVHSFVQPWLNLSPGDAAALSPQLHLPTAVPPTLAVVGTRETEEFERQSRDWAAACQAAGLDVEFRTLERNHFDILDDLADPDGELARAVLGFLGR